MISKTLKSAIANAENNNNLRAESLVVREAVIGEGPTLKRVQPKARGSAGPIRKRTSHIRIVVTDEIEIKTREPQEARRPEEGETGRTAPKPPRRQPGRSPRLHAAPEPTPAVETKVAETPEENRRRGELRQTGE